MRKKQEIRVDYGYIWANGLPLNLIFFLQRVWKRRIPTDDNLKRMKIHMVSRCWCCQTREEETMSHFSDSFHSQQALEAVCYFCRYKHEGDASIATSNSMVEINASSKLQGIQRPMPEIFMWAIQKMRNNIKHRANTSLSGMVMKVQDLVKKLVYPRIYMQTRLWPDIVQKLKCYKRFTFTM